MNFHELGPVETMWEGKYVKVSRRGTWEYAGRANGIRAVVILAEVDGKVILVDQPRVPLQRRCLELPAGLIGDEDPNVTVESTAIKELEEEAGYTADRVEVIGDFYASPGMLSESFTLVRVHGVRKVGEGGGTEHEDIRVHLVPRAEIPDFIAKSRADGLCIDVKLLLFLNG